MHARVRENTTLKSIQERVFINSRRDGKGIVTFVDLDFSHSGFNSRSDVCSTMPRGSPSSPLLHLS
jgi:hypothetical protein